MEKILKYLLSISFVLFAIACDENEIDEESVESIVQDEMYFPPVGSDDWATKDVEELGWNAASLQAAIDYAREKNSYSLIILHKGKIIAEHYWKETNRTTKHSIESVGKSMMAFLIGVLQQEFDVNINEKVSAYIGTGWSKAPLEKENLITVKHLITMTSGLDYELNFLNDAGKVWYYSTEAHDVLFKIIHAVSGLTGVEFSNTYLFSRIGMKNAVWQNTTLECTARDMARFGLLILAKGKWEENKILNNDRYYDAMLNTSQSLQPAYGYLWWLNGKEFYYEYDENAVYPGPLHPSMPADGLIAAGFDEQRIEVIPSKDLVVVRQGASPQTPERGNDSYSNAFWQRLTQAITN